MICIFFPQLLPNSFVSSVLHTKDVRKLRLGQRTYGGLVESIPAFEHSRFLYADAACPSKWSEVQALCMKVLQAQTRLPEDDEKVVIYNFAYYPLDLDWVDNLFHKAMQTDIPLFVEKYSNQTADQPARFVAACMTYQQLMEATLESSEPARVQAGDDQIANLGHTATALRLFGSGFSLRHFNSLQPSRNVFFLKLSSVVEKMQAEYDFFRQLPAPVRPYFPQVGDLVMEADRSGYEIEAVPCLDVAKSLLNGVFANRHDGELLMSLLDQYLQSCPAQKVGEEVYARRAEALFVDKLKKRVDMLLQHACVPKMDVMCQMNGMDSVAHFAELYVAALQKDIKQHKEDTLVFSHGDLFFSNILFDSIKEYIKLIDPRGRFSPQAEDDYMPAWYDLAKLSHSFLGHYDLMVYDMIDVVMQRDLTLGLKDAHVPGMALLEQTFLDYLKKRNISVKRLRLYEGSLFLSMMPLHAEDELRMHRQLIRAMELYRFSTT